MKKILMIVGVILILALVAGGSFWGGMAYQDNQVSQAQANFENARGQMNGDITASQVTILSNNPAAMANPSLGETEP